MAAIDPVLGEGEVLESADFVEVIFDFLNDAGCAVLAHVIHGVEGLEDAAPLLWLALHLDPQVLHDHIVVFPVVSVVGQHLQLAV